MKKKNLNAKLNLRKAHVADLNADKVKGGLARTLQKNCVSYPYRCSIVECQITDVTCYHTQTCEPVSGVTDVAITC